MIGNKIFITLAALFLTACTMTPEYTRPTPPVPADWPVGEAYQDTKTGAVTLSAPELSWQEYFSDERLQKVILMALHHNRDLRLSALNVERARAVYGIQRAEQFPILKTVGNLAKARVPEDISTTGTARDTSYYSVDLGILSWEIDFFGRIRSLKDKALEDYLTSEHARRGAQVSLVSTVAAAYLVLAADRENLELARSTLAAQQSTYALIQRRFEVGLNTELDLRRAQTQVESARGDVSLYTRLAAQDENMLNLLIGSPIPKELLPPDVKSLIPLLELSPGLSSEVLLRRPDILAAEHQLKAANANIGAARAAFFPRISLTSTIGTASYELSRLFQSTSGTWNFASQVVMPIFDSRSWAMLKGVKVEREIAVTQYEKAIQIAFKEVADALALRGTIREQISAQESLVQAAGITYRLTEARYSKGIDSYLSVLDAQRSFYAAEKGLISLRLARFTNQATLYKVLGGGSQSPGQQD